MSQAWAAILCQPPRSPDLLSIEKMWDWLGTVYLGVFVFFSKYSYINIFLAIWKFYELFQEHKFISGTSIARFIVYRKSVELIGYLYSEFGHYLGILDQLSHQLKMLGMLYFQGTLKISLIAFFVVYWNDGVRVGSTCLTLLQLFSKGKSTICF